MTRTSRSGIRLLPLTNLAYETRATSALADADAATIRTGLNDALTWLVRVADSDLFASLRGAGRAEFTVSPEGANLAELLALIDGLYAEDVPYGERLVDRIGLNCALHGAAVQALGWYEVVSTALDKLGSEALAVEVPGKAVEALHELASWLVHVAECSARALTEVPTVADVLTAE